MIEPLVTALWPEVGRFGPTGSLVSAVQGLDPEDVGTAEVRFPSVGRRWPACSP